MALLIIVFALLAGLSLVALARDLRRDGYGVRPPPSSRDTSRGDAAAAPTEVGRRARRPWSPR
ncbi:hypothetical protein BHE97_03010 [Aeromicrobium sp. PE09-221]|nr:hypothetical protein BHE97_03010 [Aeromicrobium sp. PE09-221]